jgi:hypothetical protein
MKYFLNSLILALLLLSCKRQEPALKKEEVAGLPPDFVTFYEKFHSDSLYQMAHISFPLEGYPSAPDSATLANKFHWTADKWMMHRTFPDSLYNRKFDMPMQSVVTEWIMQKNVPYGTYRRFLKRGDSWSLIFYSDMNRIDPNN